MIKSLTITISLLLVLATAVASCGYDDVVTDKVEAVRVSDFDNSGELPKKIEDRTCPRMAYMLWLSFQLRDYADVAHLAQGIYVAVATNAAGERTTMKFVKK